MATVSVPVPAPVSASLSLSLSLSLPLSLSLSLSLSQCCVCLCASTCATQFFAIPITCTGRRLRLLPQESELVGGHDITRVKEQTISSPPLPQRF
ncbi:hypothetical protein K504DRAFT_464127 [Pleomassaria siparia CBS 279.74]|uniref:Secreted protein n=1 Tax=Pleomassaria siparia CBS 279.74 TaxID=1314801 RepID=A0A6G1KGJ5_9PLEO|nr:hypothetical protein K504DRAFT_464127 [Pleomassaria siparia CBS 279.74]